MPLSGVRVVDLTQWVSGPYCTMTLADLGADVVKIEPFPLGDGSRGFPPHHEGESYCFAMVNRNKRGMGVDLKSETGSEVMRRLIADADVVVENFRPGVAARLKLGYDDVRAIRPDVIYCSISGFGQTGPYATRPGFDIIAQGMTGFLSMTGHADGAPSKVGINISDIAAGTTATQNILAALLNRERTGEGQYLDVSLLESGLAWTVFEAAAYFGTGELPERTGTRHRRSAPYQAFRTQDGYVIIGAASDRLWARLCTDVLERPELSGDPRYATMEDRLRHVDELEEELEAILSERSSAAWLERLEQAGIPGGPVNTYDQTLSDAHVRDRGMVRQAEHPKLGVIEQLGYPAKWSTHEFPIERTAPVLGQHTDEILASLDFSADQITSMHGSGAVFQADL